MLKRPVRPASPSRCQSRAAPRASLSTPCPPCTCLSRGSPALAPRPAGAPPPQRCVHRSVRPPGPLSSRGRGSWVPPPTSVPFRPASPLSERRRGVGRRTCGDLSSGSPGAGGPRLRRRQCGEPGVRRLGRGAWAAQGEASGAATPGSGPHQQLCNKSPGLSVPGFVTTGKQDMAQHLCPETPSSCVLQARALNWWPGPQRRGEW